MALQSIHRNHSRETVYGKTSPPTNEQNQNRDSPTLSPQDEVATTNRNKEAQTVIGKKPPQAGPNLVTRTGPDDPVNPHN